MAAREKKPQSKNTVIEGIDTQQWTVNLKNEILKQRKMTPENAGHLAEEIVANYKKYRAEGKNHNQALEATQKKTSESCEKMYNQHQAQKSLNAYEVGLQPAAFPLVAAPIMAPALMVEISAFMTAIAVSCKLTEEAPKSTKSNSPYVNAPPYAMDAAPSGPGADFSDKGFEIHTPEPVIHITPIADALPALGGYEAAPQEFLNGIPEGFTKVDLPDTFILTSDGHPNAAQKVYEQYVEGDRIAAFEAKHGKKAVQNMTDAELAQSLADRAERINPGAKGPRAGTEKHKYAERVWDRYQEMTGKRPDLVAEARYKGGEEWAEGMGLKNSVKPDLYNTETKQPFDYKFGGAKVTPGQRARYKAQLPKGSVPIHEVKPNKP